MSYSLTYHLHSIRSQGECWYPFVDRWDKTVPSHHQEDCQAYHGPRQPVSDCADPATLLRTLKVFDSDPGLESKCGNWFQSIRMLTRTLDGNASFVIHLILLMKFIAAVLHSRESIWKWSRTSNVNAVCGLMKLAGNSLARRRSCVYWRVDLAQLHHQIDLVNIPVDDTIVIFDRYPFVVDSESADGWFPCINSLDPLERSRVDGLVSVLCCIDGQSSG